MQTNSAAFFLKSSLLGVLLLVLFQNIAIAAPQGDVPNTLEEIVLRNWSAWSQGKQTVDLAQLELALGDYGVRGENAALLSSLVKKTRIEQENTPVDLATAVGWVREDKNLQYEFFKKMLFDTGNQQRSVISRKRAHFESLQFEQNLDGAVLSAMGCIAANQPRSIAAALRYVDDNRYEVRFPSGKKVIMRAPSEGETLNSELMRTLEDGTWAILLYDAFQQNLSATPTPGEVQKVWTGVVSSVLPLSGMAAPQVGGQLDAALKQGRLVQAVLSVDAERPVPGLAYGQSYSVLRFDASRSEVVLWQPHAGFFQPQGAESRENGYLMAAGIIQMPLTAFQQIFTSLVVSGR